MISTTLAQFVLVTVTIAHVIVTTVLATVTTHAHVTVTTVIFA